MVEQRKNLPSNINIGEINKKITNAGGANCRMVVTTLYF